MLGCRRFTTALVLNDASRGTGQPYKLTLEGACYRQRVGFAGCLRKMLLVLNRRLSNCSIVRWHSHLETAAHDPSRVIDLVPCGEKMLYSGTDLESYITEYTLVYGENPK